MNLIRRYAAFTAFAAVLLIVTATLLVWIDPARALLCGFDAGAIVFFAVLIRRLADEEAEDMRIRARENEPDHHLLTAIAMIIVAVVLTAVFVELSGKGGRQGTGIALAIMTLILAWLFANTLFALHYAYVWYRPSCEGGADGDRKGDRKGLDFPGKNTTPDYWDFAYFAFVLGMTFQVSDVVITEKGLRRLALVHALLAFLFNIGVVAVSVNLVASVMGG